MIFRSLEDFEDNLNKENDRKGLYPLLLPEDKQLEYHNYDH